MRKGSPEEDSGQDWSVLMRGFAAKGIPKGLSPETASVVVGLVLLTLSPATMMAGYRDPAVTVFDLSLMAMPR